MLRLILTCLFLPMFGHAADGKLKVTWLELPMPGLTAVLETPSGKVCLIDTGNSKPGEGKDDYNSGRDTIAPYLKEHGYNEIEAIAISHPHGDHFGGAEWLLGNLPVKQFIDHGYDGRGQKLGYTRLRGLAAQRGGKHVVVHAGDTLNWDPDLKVEVLSPPKEFFDANGDPAKVTEPDLINSNSVIIRVQHGKNVFIFPGDAYGPSFETFMKSESLAPKLKATVLTANQHGFSPGIDFPKLVMPKYVVTPCIADYPANEGTAKPRSPGDKAIQVYGALGAEVFVTGFHGNITAVSDGETVTMTKAHERAKP